MSPCPARPWPGMLWPMGYPWAALRRRYKRHRAERYRQGRLLCGSPREDGAHPCRGERSSVVVKPRAGSDWARPAGGGCGDTSALRPRCACAGHRPPTVADAMRPGCRRWCTGRGRRAGPSGEHHGRPTPGFGDTRRSRDTGTADRGAGGVERIFALTRIEVRCQHSELLKASKEHAFLRCQASRDCGNAMIPRCHSAAVASPLTMSSPRFGLSAWAAQGE